MNFLFTCGGTAGHINPAIAVAGKIREKYPDSGILFVGAKGMMETELVPREGYDIVTVEITNISRSMSPKGIAHNVKTLRNVVASTAQAKKIIKDFKPDAAIGTGGYVCYPVLKAAHSLGVPAFIHESNAVPGLTTKLLSGIVDCVMTGFEDAGASYKKGCRVVFTGNPVRADFAAEGKLKAKAELGLDPGKPLLLSVWGSLGSAFMNDKMTEFIKIASEKQEMNLIHSAGKRGYAGMKETLDRSCPDYASRGMDVREYIFNMPLVMTAADLIICRSGASTLGELAATGKPAILVPSPNVTGNHQEKNARLLEARGAARVMLEGEFDPAGLYSEVSSLISSRASLESMSGAMRSFAVDDAAERIRDIILAGIER